MSLPLYSNLGFEQPIELSKGSTFLVELSVMDGDEPYNLTGCQVRAVLQSTIDPLLKKNFVFEPGSIDGLARGELSDTADLVANDKRLSVSQYRWACEIKTADGKILPFCYGPVAVRSNGVDWE